MPCDNWTYYADHDDFIVRTRGDEAQLWHYKEHYWKNWNYKNYYPSINSAAWGMDFTEQDPQTLARYIKREYGQDLLIV